MWISVGGSLLSLPHYVSTALLLKSELLTMALRSLVIWPLPTSQTLRPHLVPYSPSPSTPLCLLLDFQVSMSLPKGLGSRSPFCLENYYSWPQLMDE